LYQGGVEIFINEYEGLFSIYVKIIYAQQDKGVMHA